MRPAAVCSRSIKASIFRTNVKRIEVQGLTKMFPCAALVNRVAEGIVWNLIKRHDNSFDVDERIEDRREPDVRAIEQIEDISDSWQCLLEVMVLEYLFHLLWRASFY